MHLLERNPRVIARPICFCGFGCLGLILPGLVALAGCGAISPSAASHSSASGNPTPPTSTSYQVDLSWDIPDSSSDPIVGYNVYRSASGAAHYQLLNNVLNADPTWIDNTVSGGAAYDYIVTSVDKSGVESAPSNTLNLNIP